MNVADIAPEGITTEAGTVRVALLSDSATVKPPEAAAALKPTVHVTVPGVTNVVGVQESEFTVVGDWELWTVMLAPVAATSAPVPFGEAAIAFEAPTEIGELLTLCANVTLTTPTTPFAIGLAFKPEAMQTIEPFPGLQEIVLPADDAAAPADTAIPAISFAA